MKFRCEAWAFLRYLQEQGSEEGALAAIAGVRPDCKNLRRHTSGLCGYCKIASKLLGNEYLTWWDKVSGVLNDAAACSGENTEWIKERADNAHQQEAAKKKACGHTDFKAKMQDTSQLAERTAEATTVSELVLMSLPSWSSSTDAALPQMCTPPQWLPTPMPIPLQQHLLQRPFPPVVHPKPLPFPPQEPPPPPPPPFPPPAPPLPPQFPPALTRKGG